MIFSIKVFIYLFSWIPDLDEFGGMELLAECVCLSGRLDDRFPEEKGRLLAILGNLRRIECIIFFQKYAHTPGTMMIVAILRLPKVIYVGPGPIIIDGVIITPLISG